MQPGRHPADPRQLRGGRRWADERQHQGLEAAVEGAMQRQLPPGVRQPPPSQVPGDRSARAVTSSPCGRAPTSDAPCVLLSPLAPGAASAASDSAPSVPFAPGAAGAASDSAPSMSLAPGAA